jgi:hypothetical protein
MTRFTFLLPEPGDTRPYDAAIALVVLLFVAYVVRLLFG